MIPIKFCNERMGFLVWVPRSAPSFQVVTSALLVETSATLVVTGALLVVTRS